MTDRVKGCRCKGQGTCKVCSKARSERLYAEAQAHVERGTCPYCGTALKRNSALTGWWQCGAYACEAMRAPEFKGLPSCSFQCFTK